jgi:hemerythrin
MESFHWNTHYETDIGSVYAQHHTLVDLINELGNAIAHSNSKAYDLQAIIGPLADYAKYHFADEEALMESSGPDPRHISIHKEAHSHFFEEIEHITSNAEQGKIAKIRLLYEYLASLLGFQILGCDQSMPHKRRNELRSGIRKIHLRQR